MKLYASSWIKNLTFFLPLEQLKFKIISPSILNLEGGMEVINVELNSLQDSKFLLPRPHKRTISALPK